LSRCIFTGEKDLAPTRCPPPATINPAAFLSGAPARQCALRGRGRPSIARIRRLHSGQDGPAEHDPTDTINAAFELFAVPIDFAFACSDRAASFAKQQKRMSLRLDHGISFPDEQT
jgi:hypothetical protein